MIEPDYLRLRVKEARYRIPSAVQSWLAWRFPRWVVYWSVQRAVGNAWSTSGSKTPDELTFEEIIKPWEKPVDPRRGS